MYIYIYTYPSLKLTAKAPEKPPVFSGGAFSDVALRAPGAQSMFCRLVAAGS